MSATRLSASPRNDTARAVHSTRNGRFVRTRRKELTRWSLHHSTRSPILVLECDVVCALGDLARAAVGPFHTARNILVDLHVAVLRSRKPIPAAAGSGCQGT